MRECELYPEITKWLLNYLRSHYRRAKIFVEDTHRVNLSDFLERLGMKDRFPEYTAYDIKVDITGLIVKHQQADLVFVECKLHAIRLLDVGQLLGYSLVAKPIHSFLLSPNGISVPLYNLLKIYGRYDILNYGKGLVLKLAQWDTRKKEPFWTSLLPPGEYLSKF